MSLFNNREKKIARENGGMENMFSTFITLFKSEGFLIENVKSTSILLKNQTDLAVGVISLKLVSESLIKILFIMEFKDGTKPSYLTIEERYNLTQSQEEIYYQLIKKVDSEISKRVRQMKEVKIGNQIWMTENLNVDKFRNGDSIPQAKTDEEWDNADDEMKPAWCYYDYSPTNGAKYGKLYNWHAVNDQRGLAPEGWHIPSDEEWSELSEFLGADAGRKMKSTNEWYSDTNGDNESGFNGLPGGSCVLTGLFGNMGLSSSWWSASESSETGVWIRVLDGDPDVFTRVETHKGMTGDYVRCIKD